jgi:hypothetical protein
LVEFPVSISIITDEVLYCPDDISAIDTTIDYSSFVQMDKVGGVKLSVIE